MFKKALTGFVVALLLSANNACGGPDDPLIGMWTQGASSTGVCQFAPNGDWSNGCGIGSGWPSSWIRIDNGEYYLGLGNGYGCDAKSAFSNGADAVILTLHCGYINATTVNLIRFRP
jgi:hypothetical protein